MIKKWSKCRLSGSGSFTKYPSGITAISSKLNPFSVTENKLIGAFYYLLTSRQMKQIKGLECFRYSVGICQLFGWSMTNTKSKKIWKQVKWAVIRLKMQHQTKRQIIKAFSCGPGPDWNKTPRLENVVWNVTAVRSL